jgi:translocation and assembly module TamA
MLVCLLLGAAAGAPSSGALAGADPAAPAGASSAGTPAAPDPAPAHSHLAYVVTVVAPSPLKETLERSVGLVRWQSFGEMSEELLDQLVREANDEARNAAAAEGYFGATIAIDVDRKSDPAAVTLAVTLGPPTIITAVRINVSGPAATDSPLGTAAIANLTAGWGLPDGAQFRQSAWTAAKNRALATLVASPYAAARITHSEALINPDSRSAELTLEIESGPAFRFGAFEIRGLTRYEPSLVRNFNG